jgi:mannose-6-phosphate isomerase-like protein (cupin superfamily)
MIISDLAHIEGRRYPAKRRTQNVVGGAAPIQAENFCLGNVTLDPNGGQVPWHNQKQEEIYFIIEGTGEMCLGHERQTVTAGQAVFIPSGVFHQLTNIGKAPLRMIYCYGPAGRRRPLATGVGWDSAEGRNRSAAIAGRGTTAVYEEAGAGSRRFRSESFKLQIGHIP